MLPDQNNRRLAFNLAALVVGMVCLAYASVPLYRIFCQMTGFGGTMRYATSLPTEVIPRKVTVRFNADTAPALPWDFKPQQLSVDVMVGENKLVFYDVKSRSAEMTYGMASYNVVPFKVGKYFNKIRCFCYEKQPMQPHQHADMPVSFFIDPEFAKDKDMADVDTITLSYTFFPVTDKNQQE